MLALKKRPRPRSASRAEVYLRNDASEGVPHHSGTDDAHRGFAGRQRSGFPSRGDDGRLLIHHFGLRLQIEPLLDTPPPRHHTFARLQLLAELEHADADGRGRLFEGGREGGRPKRNVGAKGDPLAGRQLPAQGAPAVDRVRTVSVASQAVVNYMVHVGTPSWSSKRPGVGLRNQDSGTRSRLSQPLITRRPESPRITPCSRLSLTPFVLPPLRPVRLHARSCSLRRRRCQPGA